MTLSTINDRLKIFTNLLENLQKQIPRTRGKELTNLMYNIKVTEDKIKEINIMIDERS